MEVSSGPIKSSIGHTTKEQRMSMIQWLQDPRNFRLITGSASDQERIVDGKKLKKVDAYKSLADFVNRQHNCHWTEKQGKGRYQSYIKLYKVFF